jgi:pimeloyl-ACP methyl ester carboxylesterase
MTIVLVHGAWGGAWCWKPVAERLRRQGHEVYAPTLSGVGDRGHIPPAIVDLDTHISDVAGLLRFEGLSRVLLVGHSYGGMVVTGAADREIGRIAGMIYLDAFLPESGQSLWDILGPEGAARHRAGAEVHDGGTSLPYMFGRPGGSAADGPPRTPQPVGTLSQPWVSVRREITWPRRHYIACRQSPGATFRATADRLAGTPGWSLDEVDANHDVPLSHPDLIAGKIAGIAAEWGIGAT